MVTTGTPWPSGTKTEVLDLENENLSCSNLSPFPLNVWGAVGSHLSLSPTICGGYIGRDKLSDKCFRYRLFLIRSTHFFFIKFEFKGLFWNLSPYLLSNDKAGNRKHP